MSDAVNLASATDANIERFLLRNGGKLLLYHGWADGVIPPQPTLMITTRRWRIYSVAMQAKRDSTCACSWHRAWRIAEAGSDRTKLAS